MDGIYNTEFKFNPKLLKHLVEELHSTEIEHALDKMSFLDSMTASPLCIRYIIRITCFIPRYLLYFNKKKQIMFAFGEENNIPKEIIIIMIQNFDYDDIVSYLKNPIKIINPRRLIFHTTKSLM